MQRNYISQKGIGGILIILAVVFVIIAIAVMAYFLLNKKTEETKTNNNDSGQSESQTVIRDDQVPLKICETGDPEQCNDPISNEDVDNIVVDDLP